MSINRYTYLMIGIRLKRDDLPFDWQDDKYLPYIEGHKDVDLRIEYGEGSDYFYIGKVLAISEPYSDELSKVVKLPGFTEVEWLISEAFDIPNPKAELWFFDLYH